MDRIDTGQVTTATPAVLDFRAAEATDEGLQTRCPREALRVWCVGRVCRCWPPCRHWEAAALAAGCRRKRSDGRAVPLHPPRKVREACHGVVQRKDPHHLSAMGVKVSRRHSRLFGFCPRAAGLVFVEVQLPQQFALAHQQVGEPGLVLERSFEFDAQVFQPLASRCQ